ncbi:MAG: hypothetical protein ACI9HK_000784 [Pirellulaceae bacterium]|jgi:hypothetical protein
MRKWITLIVLVAFSATAEQLVRGDDSLFSKVRVDSTFSSQKDDTTANRAPVGTKLTDAGQLLRLLNEIGVKAEELGSKAIGFQMGKAPDSFLIVVRISDDENQLEVKVRLAQAGENQELPADKSLGLLTATRKYAPSRFAYNGELRAIMLLHNVSNEGTDAKVLGDQLLRLLAIAKETRKLWDIAKADPTGPAETETPSENNLTLVGTWSAVQSATEAFAIQLKSDGKFALVYVNSGKQNRSTGTYSFNGESLNLLGGDGLKLNGGVSNLSEKQFQVEFQPGSSLTFKSAGQGK